MKTEKILGMTQEMLYPTKFCLEIECARQATRNSILRVQKYQQLYGSNQGCVGQD